MIVTCPDCATRYRVDDSSFSDGGRAVRCNSCGCEWYQIGPSPAQAAASADTDALQLSTVQINAPKAGRESHVKPMSLDDGEVSEQPRPQPQARANVSFAAESFPDASVSSAPGANGAGGFDAGGYDDHAESDDLEEEHEPAEREKTEGFAHSVPVVVDADGPRAMGVRSDRKQRSGGLLPGLALVGVSAAVLGGVGFYYYGPELKTAAPATAPAVDTYRDQVDAVFASSAASREASEGVVFVEYKYDLASLPEGPALLVEGRVANNGPNVELTPIIEIVSRDKNGVKLQRWLARPDVDQLKPGETARFTSKMMFPLEPVYDVDFYIAPR